MFWDLNCRNVAQKDTKWKEYRYLGISKKLLNEKILYVQTHYRQTYSEILNIIRLRKKLWVWQMKMLF